MPREALISNNERQFLRDCLESGTRLDDRQPLQFRDLNVRFGDDYGNVEVTLGKTRVSVKVTAQVSAPLPERKFDGIFTVSTELTPLTNVVSDVGRLGKAEAILSRMLEKTVRRSSAVDTESLCLVAGKTCFSVRADVHILANDGNVIDASSIALIAALQHFRRPDVSVEGGEARVYSASEREPVKLKLLHHPICVSVSTFGSETFVLDASAAEEKTRDGEIIVGANGYGEICHMAKLGGPPVPASRLKLFADLATDKTKDISRLLESKVRSEEQRREELGKLGELTAENQRVVA